MKNLMHTLKEKLPGYAIPAGTAGGSAYASPNPSDVTLADVSAKALQGEPITGGEWVVEYFPELVQNGDLVLANGTIYFHGLNVISIVSFLGITAGLIATLIKLGIDIGFFRFSWRHIKSGIQNLKQFKNKQLPNFKQKLKKLFGKK